MKFEKCVCGKKFEPWGRAESDWQFSCEANLPNDEQFQCSWEVKGLIWKNTESNDFRHFGEMTFEEAERLMKLLVFK